MRRTFTRHWPVALALLLMVAGAGFVLAGLRTLWKSEGTGSGTTASPLPATPAPTSTEPILPPLPTPSQPPAPTPAGRTESPEALVPSSTPAFTPVTEGSPSAIPPTPIAPSPSPTALEKGLYSLHERLGVGSSAVPVTQDAANRLGFGWYLDWWAGPEAFRSAEVQYLPMVRFRDGLPSPSGPALLAAVDALPGATWLIGNEPDVRWQDNMAADLYAEAYHELYALLKARDPTCQVAIGGISQPTPLRLHYLDLVLETYQKRYGEPMPVDVWNIHNFILREERDSWGVDIPPGMTEQAGLLREIMDHDDLGIFRQQIVDFRRWMKDRAQQDKPLIVTEYGILMPAEYGFPPERVERFMLESFEFLRTAADPTLGHPADGYRLVQRWCWFSLADERYPTGNLLRQDSQEPTALGAAFGRYARSTP